MMEIDVDELAQAHARNLAVATRAQIELARVFQRAVFADDNPLVNTTKREMEEQPDTFIPAPLYLDMAMKFAGSPWKEKLLEALDGETH